MVILGKYSNLDICSVRDPLVLSGKILVSTTKFTKSTKQDLVKGTDASLEVVVLIVIHKIELQPSLCPDNRRDRYVSQFEERRNDNGTTTRDNK